MPGFSCSVDNRLRHTLPARRAAARRSVVAAVTRVGMAWAGKTQVDMRNSGLYARGDLIRSIRARNTTHGGLVASTLVANVEYAKWVHGGRKPGKMPPMKPILDWVHIKRMTGRYSIKTHRRLGNKYQQRFEDFEVARRIQWAIYKRGIRPKPFFNQSFDAHKDWAHRSLRSQIPAAVKQTWGRL